MPMSSDESAKLLLSLGAWCPRHPKRTLPIASLFPICWKRWVSGQNISSYMSSHSGWQWGNCRMTETSLTYLGCP
jgi:hypothetical protein